MDRFWNLLIHPSLPPALNMAVDWWLLETLQHPTLRFYRWDRPCFSLGYRQQTNPPDVLRRDGLRDHCLVVRPTGGGYLYHSGDLSYSFLFPENSDIASSGIKDAYRTLTLPLVDAVESLGLIDNPEWGHDDSSSPNCLEAPSSHEPTSEGKKWMAAAQARSNRKFLQQGSLFLEPNWPKPLQETSPKFLAPEEDYPGEPRFLSTIINHLAGKVFDGIPGRPRTLRTDAWEDITSIAGQFRVESLEELPLFDRLSARKE